MPRKKKDRPGGPILPDTQVQTLNRYLGNFFPDVLLTHGRTRGFESTASATIELLDQLREFQRERAKSHHDAQASLDQMRANSVKSAVARLIGGLDKLTAEDLKKQAVEMIGDAKFWNVLTNIEYSRDEMKRMLGPYA